MSYECLLAGLPDLHADMESPMTEQALLVQLDESLTAYDKEQLALLRMRSDDPLIDEIVERYRDNLMDQPSWWDDACRVLSEEDLRTQILYEYGMARGCPFVRKWFEYNQDMNNVMAATICRKHGMPVEKAIVGDNEVALILRKNLPNKDFGLGGVLDMLPEIMSVVEKTNLMEREKKMDALRFIWLEEQTRFVYFQRENVLAYWLELQMLNRWSMLTVDKGEQVFREIVAEMRSGISFDE